MFAASCRIVGLFFLLLCAPLTATLHAQGLNAQGLNALQSARAAQPLRTPTTRLELQDLIGKKPVILHFWATWCAPCRRELPSLARFLNDKATRPYAGQVILIALDRGPYAKIDRFLNQRLKLPTLRSFQAEGFETGSLFGLKAYPTTLIMDANYRVKGRLSGAMDWDNPTIRRKLRAILRGAPLRKPTKRRKKRFDRKDEPV